MNQLDRLARIVLNGTQAELEAWARDHNARKARKAAKKAPGRAVAATKKATRTENWSRTRETVLARAGGRCELCGCIGFDLDCHHLASGPLRRKYEAPNSVVACCRTCHNGWHRGSTVEMVASLEVAARIGAPDIVRANLNRRIQKATQRTA